MKKLILVFALIVAALPALCEGTGTFIEWPGWRVASTEDLFMGYKHTSFPLTYLFDNNPATAWVFSGTGKHEGGRETGYAITLTRDEGRKPVSVDSLSIMSGYNKSRKLFFRNNRITRLKLYVNERFLNTVELADSTGWHRISIPRQPVREIKLEFTGFRKGRDDDVCVSEIALYSRGRQIDLKMPKAVVFTPGSDCGCGQAYYVIDRRGKRLAEYNVESPSAAWSPGGRYVAGGNGEFWVVDAAAAKVIKRRTILTGGWLVLDKITWKGDRFVVVDVRKDIPLKTAAGGYRSKHFTKTFKIAGR